MKIFVNDAVNPTSDLSSIDDWTLVYDWHAEDGASPGTDGTPFQNCPSFCENTDGAVCYGDLVLDDGLFTQGDGYYTFMWYWGFNSETDLYTTCWEAYVTTTGDGGSTFEDDDDDDDDSVEVAYYYVTIPVCYSGAAYDEEIIEGSVEDMFSDDGYDISIGVSSLVQGTNSWNGTLFVRVDDIEPSVITTAASDGSICSALESGYGTGSCSICADVESKEFFTVSGSVSDYDTESTVTIIIWLIIAIFLMLICIGGSVVLRNKGMIDCTERGEVIWNGGSNSAPNSNNQKNIVKI